MEVKNGMKRCPVCGYESESGEECPTCGIILVDAKSGLVDEEQVKAIIKKNNSRSGGLVAVGVVAAVVVVSVFICLSVKNHFSKEAMVDNRGNVGDETIVDNSTEMEFDSEDFSEDDYNAAEEIDSGDSELDDSELDNVDNVDNEDDVDNSSIVDESSTVVSDPNPKKKKSKYILKKSDSTYISKSDLRKLSSKKLTYARNEIYARHGYIFHSEELTKYFSKKNWYHPNSSFNESSDFNEYEKYNAKFILEYQNKHNKQYKPK